MTKKARLKLKMQKMRSDRLYRKMARCIGDVNNLPLYTGDGSDISALNVYTYVFSRPGIAMQKDDTTGADDGGPAYNNSWYEWILSPDPNDPNYSKYQSDSVQFINWENQTGNAQQAQSTKDLKQSQAAENAPWYSNIKTPFLWVAGSIAAIVLGKAVIDNSDKIKKVFH